MKNTLFLAFAALALTQSALADDITLVSLKKSSTTSSSFGLVDNNLPSTGYLYYTDYALCFQLGAVNDTGTFMFFSTGMTGCGLMLGANNGNLVVKFGTKIWNFADAFYYDDISISNTTFLIIGTTTSYSLYIGPSATELTLLDMYPESYMELGTYGALSLVGRDSDVNIPDTGSGFHTSEVLTEITGVQAATAPSGANLEPEVFLTAFGMSLAADKNVPEPTSTTLSLLALSALLLRRRRAA